MKQYQDLMAEVFAKGTPKKDRTGTGTLSIFGHQMRFNLQEGFPLVTTKRCHLRSIIHELLWFLKGDTNIQYLKDNGVTIWDEWCLAEDEVVNKPLVKSERAKLAVEGEYCKEDLLQLIKKLDKMGPVAGQQYLDEMGVPKTLPSIMRRAGDLGPVYGKQWRAWQHHEIIAADDKEGLDNATSKGGEWIAGGDDLMNGDTTPYVYRFETDQIAKVMDQLKNDPDNRRIIVSAWNVADLDDMALAPCHAFFQFYTREMSLDERVQWAEENDNELWSDYIHATFVDENTRLGWLDKAGVPTRKLSCQLYQRSADVFLGVPFNIASYALLIHMFAQQANMAVGDFVWTGGDVHLYSNHLEQARTQLGRTPRELPKLIIKRKPDSIFDYKFEDFELENYNPHESIKAPVAV